MTRRSKRFTFAPLGHKIVEQNTGQDLLASDSLFIKFSL